MNIEEIKKLNREADIKLYKEHNYVAAFDIYKRLVDEDFPSACFMCGLILEKGWIDGGANLDAALPFYEKLAVRWNDDEGYLGIARIILEKHDSDQRDKALKYCMNVTHGLRKRKRLAFLLLGRIYEEMTNPPDFRRARKAYVKSFWCGSAWALRQYAMSLVGSGNQVRGICMHVIATIVSPVMVLFLGRGATRRG